MVKKSDFKDNTDSKFIVPSLQVVFDWPLKFHQISDFRRAYIKALGNLSLDLFHNHSEGDKNYLYRYPNIQYRVFNGKASIFSFGKGENQLRTNVLMVRSLQIGLQIYQLKLSEIIDNDLVFFKQAQFEYYRLHHWLPLNEQNYRQWLKLDSLHDRVDLLEQILAAHLISFAKGIGWQIEGNFEVSLVDLIQHKVVKVHRNALMAFDIVYKTNLALPPQIALGKAVSHGFGWQIPYRKK